MNPMALSHSTQQREEREWLKQFDALIIPKMDLQMQLIFWGSKGKNLNFKTKSAMIWYNLSYININITLNYIYHESW